jgi:S-adenosylmethionine:tRNA ribosyltransferase-isomerase
MAPAAHDAGHGMRPGATPAPAAGSATPLTLADLDYELPPELIAQHPVEPRDASRMLVVRRSGAGLEDRGFRDLPGLLRCDDVLVRNDTRVFPARAFFKRPSGGRIEALFLRPLEAGARQERWEALLRGRPQRGERLASEALGEAWRVRCDEPLGEGRWALVSESPSPVLDLLHEAGRTPLPPYIHAPLEDGERYQTVYARAVGSSAAPTAGLHFTPIVDAALAEAGVNVETVTLHVGLGTFRPLHEERLDDNQLHAERYVVEGAAWRCIAGARADGRRVVAVGTTTVRTLEHLARQGGEPDADDVLRGETDLFIRPGFAFQVVDALLTNFHLPRSSLLALVMAFCGVEQARAAYRHAIERRYRFYSFGDAMLAL